MSYWTYNTLGIPTYPLGGSWSIYYGFKGAEYDGFDKLIFLFESFAKAYCKTDINTLATNDGKGIKDSMKALSNKIK